MTETVLVFGHGGARYALDALTVREIVWLPELASVEELPRYFSGVFRRRGAIVPVMDLTLRFEHPRLPYRPTDRIVLVEIEDARFGIIVSELHDVLAVTPQQIEGAAAYQVGLGKVAQFVRGVVKLDDGIAMLLDVQALVRTLPDAQVLREIEPAPQADAEAHPGSVDRFPWDLSAAEAALLRERARELARTADDDGDAASSAFAVVGIDGELFGLPAAMVHEFCHVRGVTPVPCCPSHIVGNMNLRGDILTLVDIRPALGMPGSGALSEVVVVRAGDLRMGVLVEKTVDVIYLPESAIAAAPVASESAAAACCNGVAKLDGRAVALLDLNKLLAARSLQVAEEAA